MADFAGKLLMFKWLTFFLFFVAMISGVAAKDLSRTAPHPSLAPLDVVMIVMNALRQNDIPKKNRGIAITFNFASPANKRVTGPIGRFVKMVSGPIYGDMLDHQGAEYENILVTGDQARIDVVIRSAVGRFVGFRFFLTKQQHNKFEGSWMTDGVMPIEVVSS